MNPVDLTRLHAERMRNDETGFRMNEMRPRFDSLRDRHINGTAPRAVAAFQLFQTPASLASRMVELADIKPCHSVLEPSAGLGRLIKPVLNCSPDRVHACEIDPTLAGELFNNFPQVELSQGDFLEKHLGEFDRIVMNPPFHMRADIKHVLHAAGHLAQKGVLVGLCMTGPHREKSIRPMCDFWEVLPSGLFRSEGTGISVTLFRIVNN